MIVWKRLKEEKVHVFFYLFFYTYIQFTLQTLADTTQIQDNTPASGFYLFFAGAWHEVRQHERRIAGDPFKACRSQATQAKAETWHFFLILRNWNHMYASWINYSIFLVDLRQMVFFIKINQHVFLFPTIYNKCMFGEKKINPMGVVDRKWHEY